MEVDALQKRIDSHGLLGTELLKKIDYFFRWEWNFTSNSMEGNTLTRDETRSVMIGNITVSGKPLKDILEVKGHDDVVIEILKMGKGELNISEKRIRQMHKAIMYETDPEKRDMIGVWKRQPNYLYNYKNERFDFVSPADVPGRMHSLMNELSSEKEKIHNQSKKAMHPVLLPFRFHLEFVSIHPFYDGNGRMSRILTNIILIAYGYPPIYIKENEKEIYYQYLGDIQGYGGDTELFYGFMADLLMRSQRIFLAAIDGRVEMEIFNSNNT